MPSTELLLPLAKPVLRNSCGGWTYGKSESWLPHWRALPSSPFPQRQPDSVHPHQHFALPSSLNSAEEVNKASDIRLLYISLLTSAFSATYPNSIGVQSPTVASSCIIQLQSGPFVGAAATAMASVVSTGSPRQSCRATPTVKVSIEKGDEDRTPTSKLNTVTLLP